MGNYLLGCLTGAVIVGAIGALVIWFKNRKAQIKGKVIDTINKV
jgi:hypothetical protein